MPENFESKGSRDISGNTLLVYWYLLENASKRVGVRTVQRAMGFSSPSTALYHLERLRNYGVIGKDGMGNYFVKKFVKISMMRNFVLLHNQLIPRHLIYAVLTTIISLTYFGLLRHFVSYPLVLASLFPSIISSILFWWETFIVWRSKPDFK